MANAKKFLVPIDLNKNELQNAAIQNLATAPSTPVAGQLYFDTVSNSVKVYNGTIWEDYSGDIKSIADAGDGSITVVNGTGGNVTLDVNEAQVDHNSLENYDVNEHRTINDAGTATTDLLSASEIDSRIATAVTSGMTYKGGYDASTNTPNLDSSPTAGTIEVGDTYTVTANGTFFTEDVQVGDMIIAEVDDPSTLADFTIVERNLNTATETSEGTVELATQAEVDAGTDTSRVITPATLSQYVINSNVAASHCENGVSIGTTPGLQTITHNLNTRCVTVSVHDTTTFEEYEVDVVKATLNTITICANGATKTVDVSVIG